MAIVNVKVRAPRRLLTLALALGAASLAPACGPEPGATDSPNSQSPGAPSLGASGPEVAAAQDYLRTFGYFPNPALAAKYPAWRPVVSEAPARPDVLDATMQRALGQLQANLGLPVTGTLDAATVAAMKSPRCGVPDGDAGAVRADKFSVRGAANRWTKTNITYRFASTGGLGSLTQGPTRALISNGIKGWETVTNLTFTEVTTGGDFAVTFGNIDGPGKILGAAQSPPSPALFIDSSESWLPIDLVAVALHEAGHIIGLNHSSLSDTVMLPFHTQHTTLTNDDDIMAANSIYNGWVPAAGGLARDIGANSSQDIDVVWVIGMDYVPWQWNGAGWTQYPGVTGTRIDVDDLGRPVVIGTDQHIYRYQGSQGGWVELAGGGRAKDVGVGQNGLIWVIGLDNQAYIFDVTINGWVFQGGPANQIAIDVKMGGAAVVVTADNQLWSNSTGTWMQIGAGFGGDIASGGGFTRNWMFGLDTAGAPYVREEQAGFSQSFPCDNPPCTTGAPAEDSWIGMGGSATRITAGMHGATWIVNASNQVLRRAEMP